MGTKLQAYKWILGVNMKAKDTSFWEDKDKSHSKKCQV